ncbi:unnamed protein product [Ranitomeya imitator]|uniref:Uncharacterized protein n=1 Tax=Ranitomeya imitator TaxID=111125 RepID=A0ABN9L9H8_9NEOB|nr:unnamed protein product [Ranitomeya imitator]
MYYGGQRMNPKTPPLWLKIVPSKFRVQGEIDVFGSHRDITYDDLHKLQYLAQVLKESLRLYPTAPGTSRLLDKELVIEGLRIPPNVSLVFNSYVYGRMEQHFQDPLSFDPDRFAP